MSGSVYPCGACKFLRRKCVRGCVFAPYFSHEQAATDFAAIHKVFGASNVSKLLGNLPVTNRREAAITISYEAQARLRDPIYGCVSHIFALQQQVVNLQEELASLTEQAAADRTVLNGSMLPTYSQLHHVQSMEPYFNPSLSVSDHHNSNSYRENGVLDPNSDIGNYYDENSIVSSEENHVSLTSIFGGEAPHSVSSHDDHMQTDNRRWTFQDFDDLQSMAFGYARSS